MLGMTSAEPRDLRTLPKGHLHLHLEGSMRPSTLAELADTAGIPVPEIRGYGSFTAFADTYLAACQVLETPRALRPTGLRGGRGQRARRGGVGGAVVLRAAPPGPLRRRRGDRRHGARRPARGGRSSSGSGVGLMLAADRTAEPSVAVTQARLAAAPRRPGRRVVRPRQRRGHRPARALRRGVRHRHATRACCPRRTRASWPDPSRCGARSRPSDPIGCSTACARSRTPSW